MKNIIKTIPIILLLISISCKDDLNETIYSELTVDNYTYKANDIYSIIGSVYSNMRSLYDPWNFIELQEISTDILCQPANASGWDDGGIFKKMHLHKWDSEHGQIQNFWGLATKGTLLANKIIDQLENKTVPIPSDESYDSFIAEMKVARAFYYWLLIDNFGDIPFVTTMSQDIPAKTDRATVYQAIIADIESALPKLSEENSAKMYGHFNKWAAKTLLANLYLNAEVYTGTAAYDKCLNECNDIIASGKYRLEANYGDCFSAHNENSVETIFAIPYDEINGGGLYINATLHAASKDKYNMRNTPWGAGSIKAVSQFIDTYDPNDSRIDDTWEHGLQFAYDGITPLLCTYDRAGKQLNYSKDLPDGLYTAEDEGYRIIKYKPESGPTSGSGAAFNLNNDVPFFRYTMVLMMKAECQLRAGQTDAAAVIVTEVRGRAFKSHPEKVTVTGAQLTANSKYKYGYVENYVIADQGDQTPVTFGGFYDELGYEFACEHTRRRDMIRFGTFTKKSWLSHKPNGDYRKVYPIPQSAINSNPNLTQADGY